MPYEDETVEFIAPPPEDMQHALHSVCGVSLTEIFETKFNTPKG